MLYVYNVALREGAVNFGLGSAISVLTIVFLVLALVLRALPRFAVVLPMYEISKSIGIYDTTYALAAALIAINQPFTIWLLRSFFAEIPRELDEAAMVIPDCAHLSPLERPTQVSALLLAWRGQRLGEVGNLSPR